MKVFWKVFVVAVWFSAAGVALSQGLAAEEKKRGNKASGAKRAASVNSAQDGSRPGKQRPPDGGQKQTLPGESPSQGQSGITVTIDAKPKRRHVPPRIIVPAKPKRSEDPYDRDGDEDQSMSKGKVPFWAQPQPPEPPRPQPGY